MAKIAFIGLGNMGEPMAINLIKAGHELFVADLFSDPVMRMCKLGAQDLNQEETYIKNVDFAISMLPAGAHVQDLYLGDYALLDKVAKNCVIIDCSTVDIATVKKLAEEAKNRGVDIVDAPVSGGISGAKAGSLSFMVGGSSKCFAAVKDLLAAMGTNIFHAGDTGAGIMAKICNNMLLGIQMSATAEALQLGIAYGLDPKVLSDIMLNSSGSNWALQVYNPCPNVAPNVPASNDYKPGFALNLMLKDLNLAMQASVEAQTTTPLGALARNLYSQHANTGNGDKDFSAIFNYFAKKDL